MTHPSSGAGTPTTLVPRWLAPQDYSGNVRYRAPSRVYGRLSRWIGVPLTSLGLAPHRYPVFRVDDRFREG